MIKEQDRIDELLPGLRQVDQFFLIPRGVLSGLRREQLYQADLIVNAVFRTQDGESLEDVVRRRLLLADNHVRREVERIAFALQSQANILKVGHEEITRYETDVANINTFALSAREGLLEVTERVKDSYDAELDTMVILVRALDKFAKSIRERISKAERRRKIIRGVIDKFFERGL